MLSKSELAHHGPEDIFIAFMTFVGAFWIMMTINVKLAIMAIFMVPLLIWLITFCNVRMNRSWSNMYSDIADVNSRVEDSVSGARLVSNTETEMIIQEALNELAQNRTTLIIAHCLATIRNADRIIVITEEGIAEEGSHKELHEKGGVFAHLHQVQFQN